MFLLFFRKTISYCPRKPHKESPARVFPPQAVVFARATGRGNAPMERRAAPAGACAQAGDGRRDIKGSPSERPTRGTGVFICFFSKFLKSIFSNKRPHKESPARVFPPQAVVFARATGRGNAPMERRAATAGACAQAGDGRRDIMGSPTERPTRCAGVFICFFLNF